MRIAIASSAVQVFRVLLVELVVPAGLDSAGEKLCGLEVRRAALEREVELPLATRI